MKGGKEMKLKDFLLLWTDNELIEIVYHLSSNGAYTAEELLSKGEYLDKTVKCSEIRIEKANDFIAEDSLFRNEFFQVISNKEIPFICLELCD